MKDKVMQTQILILEYFLSSQESDSIKERNKIKMTLSTIWGHSKLEYLGGMDTEQLKFIISRIETKHCRRSANSTHLSERTSLYPPSLGALPPHSPERQKEPQAMVSLQHHRNPHQGHQFSDLGLPRAEQGSNETTVSGLIWEIPKIPSDPEFLSH